MDSDQTATKFSTEPVNVKTPVAGHDVVLKGFVTARMQLATRGVFLRYTHLNMGATKGKTKDQIEKMDQSELTSFSDEIPAEVINEINELTLQYMVLKVDGQDVNKDTVLDIVLEYPPEDYEFLVAECNKISKSSSVSDADKKK